MSNRAKQTNVLVTIRFSHYCEKVRWVLDRYRVPYEERPYLPFMHMPGVLRVSRGIGASDSTSSSFSTPVLLTDTGSLLHDSRDILYYANGRYGSCNASLFPTDEVKELDGLFHYKLGPITRRISYYYCLQLDHVLYKIAPINVGKAQSTMFKRAYPWVKRGIENGLNITRDRVKKDESTLFGLIEEVGSVLEESRAKYGENAYLCSDKFTAADLSLACMLAPVLLVQPEEGYAARMPSVNEVSSAFQSLVHRVRSSVVGEYCLRMFREERGQRVLPCTAGDLLLHTADDDVPTSRL